MYKEGNWRQQSQNVICRVLVPKPSKIKEQRVCIKLGQSGKVPWREGNSRWALKTGRNVFCQVFQAGEQHIQNSTGVQKQIQVAKGSLVKWHVVEGGELSRGKAYFQLCLLALNPQHAEISLFYSSMQPVRSLSDNGKRHRQKINEEGSDTICISYGAFWKEGRSWAQGKRRTLICPQYKGQIFKISALPLLTFPRIPSLPSQYSACSSKCMNAWMAWQNTLRFISVGQSYILIFPLLTTLSTAGSSVRL